MFSSKEFKEKYCPNILSNFFRFDNVGALEGKGVDRTRVGFFDGFDGISFDDTVGSGVGVANFVGRFVGKEKGPRVGF